MIEREESMVERVAKAILKSRFYDCEPDAYDNDLDLFYVNLDPDHVIDAHVEARAAIEAMRTPTVAMLVETLPMTGTHCDPKTTRIAAEAVSILPPSAFDYRPCNKSLDAARMLMSDWYAMIDAALKEGS